MKWCLSTQTERGEHAIRQATSSRLLNVDQLPFKHLVTQAEWVKDQWKAFHPFGANAYNCPACGIVLSAVAVCL